MAKSKHDLTAKLNGLNYKVVSFVLLLIIVAMFAFWQPWDQTAANARTIEVTGEATQTALADEYEFYPSYTFTNIDKAAALAELTVKSEAVVSALEKLGVDEDKIKITADGQEGRPYAADYDKATDSSYMMMPEADDDTYLLQIGVTVNDEELAQKVQDYLVTTTPTGSVTPVASFSDELRKELEGKARAEAAKDARAKAEQSAETLGFKIGKVKTVQDGSGFGGIAYLESRTTQLDMMASSQLEVRPGEYELPYSVTVTYYVK